MTAATAPAQRHATCVDVDGIGVLILGDAGAGKSDLALRLIDGGAKLVADDRTDVRREGGLLIATAPHALKGRMEVRGIGIVPLPPEQVLAETTLAFAVRLQAQPTIPRLPEPQQETILDVALPLWRIDPAAASAPARMRLLAQTLKRGIVRFDDDLTS